MNAILIPNAITPAKALNEFATLMCAVREFQSDINRLLAKQFDTIARMVALRDSSPTEWWVRTTEEELAQQLGLSTAQARDRVSIAVALTTRLPLTRDSLHSGGAGYPQVKALVDLTATTSAETTAVIEEKVAADCGTRKPDRLRDRVRDIIHRTEPEAITARRHAAREKRHARTRLDEDGMATLSVHGPAELVAAAWASLDKQVSAIQARGDTRSLEAIRADLILGRLTGPVGDLGRPITARVGVVLSLDTLLGLDNRPARLAGHGAIDAEKARELAFAEGSLWYRIIADPLTGYALHHDRRTYRPPIALADHIRTRNPRCVFPGCRRPAQRCEIDHTTRFPDGLTNHDNLGPLCRFHHMLKHSGVGWILTQPTAGTFVWKSPSGTIYVVTPEQYLDPPPSKQQRKNRSPQARGEISVPALRAA